MTAKDKNKQKKRWKIIAIAIIIILLLLILVKLYFEFALERARLAEFRAEKNRIEQEFQSRESLIDSLCVIFPAECENFEDFGNVGTLMVFAQSLLDRQDLNEFEEIAVEKTDTLPQKRRTDDLSRNREAEAEAEARRRLREQAIADSIEQENQRRMQREQEIADSIAKAQAQYEANRRSVCQDTITPRVFPTPTGGLHYEPIRVNFVVNKPNVSVFFKRSRDSEFRLWGGEFISISQNTQLIYYAVDECGNRSEEQVKVYEFRQRRAENRCPDGMTFVESAQGNFCIDQFQFPNQRGVRPMNMVSQMAARDSCQAAGKRLCTADEWRTACRGPYNWRYPYGNNYIRQACITQDSTFRASGEAGECRGWYAIYDMVGNLAEWTSTRAPENQRHFLVMGGFWESGAAATCEMARHSYFPQNQHNQVGFRCCKSLE